MMQVSHSFRLINFEKIIGWKGQGHPADLFVVQGKISLESRELCDDASDIIDLRGCWIVPGWFDPQVNGLGECNFWDLTYTNSEEVFEKIDALRITLAAQGVTRFLPTIITAPLQTIKDQVALLSHYVASALDKPGAVPVGIHIEGIFITRYGVHNPAYARTDLSPLMLESLVNEQVKIFTVAPELDVSGDAIRFLHNKGIIASIGHSNGSYREGMRAVYDYGMGIVTHMFNALRGIEGFDHRSSAAGNLQRVQAKLDFKTLIDENRDGIVLALLQAAPHLRYLLNTDGVHVSSEVMRFLAQKARKDCLIPTSDMAARSVVELAGTKGIIGGGLASLGQCVNNLASIQSCSLEDTLLAASRPLAKHLRGVAGLGVIEEEQDAHLTIFDPKVGCVRGSIIGREIFMPRC